MCLYQTLGLVIWGKPQLPGSHTRLDHPRSFSYTLNKPAPNALCTACAGALSAGKTPAQSNLLCVLLILTNHVNPVSSWTQVMGLMVQLLAVDK